MRSPIAKTDRSGNTIKITALSRELGNPRLTGDSCIFKNVYGKFQNQFQPIHTNNELRALQGNNVARNEAIPNAETQTKHSLSTYADDEKSWLETKADEERSKSTGFMLRLKLRWDEQYPEKNRVSKQNLRDNAARFKKELEMNVGSEKAQTESKEDTTLNNTHKWTTEMKVNLLKIEERERNRGRRFMKRMKEAWDGIYKNSIMSAQTLRYNAVRFRKGNSLINLILLARDGNELEPEAIDIRAIEPVISQKNVENNENNEEEIMENIKEEKDEETRIMRLRFEEMLQTLKTSTKENIEGREPLIKLTKEVAKPEIGRAKKILEKHLGNTSNVCTVIDAVYAMVQTVEERKGLKRNEKRKKRKTRKEQIREYKNLKSRINN